MQLQRYLTLFTLTPLTFQLSRILQLLVQIKVSILVQVNFYFMYIYQIIGVFRVKSSTIDLMDGLKIYQTITNSLQFENSIVKMFSNSLFKNNGKTYTRGGVIENLHSEYIFD